MEGMKNSNEKNKKKPFSLMDSSSLPLAPSSFQVWKKPYFMDYGDSEASISGTKRYYPTLPSDQLLMVNDDNNKTSSNQNQSPPSYDHKMMIPSRGDTAGVDASGTRKAEHDMDPKKLRRIMSNRASAQKSRMKKLQYVIDMEKKAKSLEDQIAVLTPQVSHYQNQQEFLQMEQKSLNQRMTTYNNNSILINAEIEENKAEVAKMRRLHLSQQQQKMQQNRLPPVWESGLEELLLCPTPGPGQMVYANPSRLGDQYNGESMEEILRQNQHKMKQVSIKCVDDHRNAADTNVLMMPPGWETGNVAPGQLPNPSFNFQTGPLQKPNMGGIEQILGLKNNMTRQDPRNAFM